MSQLAQLTDRSAKLRVYLNDLVHAEKPAPKMDSKLLTEQTEYAAVRELTELELDLIVTHVEVNDLHGTGILIKRMFPDWRRIMQIWTCNAYPVNDFGVIQLFVNGWQVSRPKMYQKALEAMQPYKVRRVLCVPFSAEDLYVSMAVAESRGVPMAVYVMDDQNLTNHRIPDAVLRSAFEKSHAVFAISPEMRDAYEAKFGIKCYLLPPLVPARELMSEPVAAEKITHGRRGILLGNIWNAEWLAEIRHVIRDAGVEIDWYGNAGKFVNFEDGELARDGIHFKGSLPDAEVCAMMRQYAFGLLPSSPDDKEDWLAKYSIPTRLVTSVAAGNLPMIVIGSEKSASSRFVKNFDVGIVCPYDSAAVTAAVDRVLQPENQRLYRENAARNAKFFSDEGIADWIWKTIEQRFPADDRFEKHLGGSGNPSGWIEPPAPPDLFHGLHESYFPYRRLARLGYRPDFFFDVGASTGVFSDLISRIFPDARKILVEPLFELHRAQTNWFFERHPEFEIVQAAVSDQPGKATFHVSEDLFSSSLMQDAVSESKPIDVEVKTLDQIAEELQITGRGLLKIDVQCAEHQVLAGATALLEKVDGVMLELSLKRFAPHAKIFPEMLALMDSLGFRYFDECGGWRLPEDGRLVQKDVLFLRKGLLEEE